MAALLKEVHSNSRLLGGRGELLPRHSLAHCVSLPEHTVVDAEVHLAAEVGQCLLALLDLWTLLSSQLLVLLPCLIGWPTILATLRNFLNGWVRRLGLRPFPPNPSFAT